MTIPITRITLASLIPIIKAGDLSNRRAQDMISSVRTVARVLGRRPEEVEAEPRLLAIRLKKVAPFAHGLSKASWNNTRSLFRAALALAKPMMPLRHQTPLLPAWQILFDRLGNLKERARVSRLLRWLSERGIGPDSVTAADLEVFRLSLATESLIRNFESSWRDSVFGWNRASKLVSGWPSVRIELPGRQDLFALPWSAFPPSLKADADDWIDRLAGRDFAADGPARPARPATLQTREYQLRSFASALVAMGREAASLRSLADLVTLDAYVLGLKFYIERRGGKSTINIHSMASMLKGVATHWVKIDEASLVKMAGVVRKLSVPGQGITAKNRERLRPFDDPQTVRAFLNLPDRLKADADSGRLPRNRAAVLAGIAVAIELEIMAPVRRKNLASIMIGQHLVRTGRMLHLVVPAEEVKNTVDQEFELPAHTAALIDWYLEKHRPHLLLGLSDALFPGAQPGALKSAAALAGQIKKTIFNYTGLTVNAHLFRHIGAKIYLDAHPGAYEVIRRVLGHKKMETTTNAYTGLETRAAVRHFDAVIEARRKAVRPI
jgi:integrase